MKLFVWSKEYYMDIGEHVFPTHKYGLIYRRLIEEGIAEEDEFVKPEMVKDGELEIIHTREHISRMKRLSKSPGGMFNGENPVNKQVYRFAKLSCGGTYKACELALENGFGMNISGGFHHAFSDHEEGFCYFNDLAYALVKLEREGRIRRAMVIDCDIHQGNGTAAILQDRKKFFTFSIHQEDNYPVKEKSSYDIGLYSHERIDDRRYLNELRVLERLISDFKPELILYEAGADPYLGDQLGGFALTKEGLRKRDEYVLGLAKKSKVPLAVCLGGGYAYKIKDLVDIHVNSARVVKASSKP